MLEPLFESYYVDRFPVAFHTGEASYLDREHHSELNEEVYLKHEADENYAAAWEETPLVMKLGTQYLLVHPHDDVPEGTLAVPDRVADEINQTETEQPVFIAKKGTAHRLARFLSGRIA